MFKRTADKTQLALTSKPLLGAERRGSEETLWSRKGQKWGRVAAHGPRYEGEYLNHASDLSRETADRT